MKDGGVRPVSTTDVDGATWNAPTRPARRGLLEASPANDTERGAPVARAVGPVRRDFTPPWVQTYATAPTCAICGGRDAVTVISEDEDGHPLRNPEPACATCASDVPTPTASSTRRAVQQELARLDERVADAVREIPGCTARELCIELGLLSELEETGRAHRFELDRVRLSLARLIRARRVRARRRARNVIFFPGAEPATSDGVRSHPRR